MQHLEHFGVSSLPKDNSACWLQGSNQTANQMTSSTHWADAAPSVGSKLWVKVYIRLRDVLISIWGGRDVKSRCSIELLRLLSEKNRRKHQKNHFCHVHDSNVLSWILHIICWKKMFSYKWPATRLIPEQHRSKHDPLLSDYCAGESLNQAFG